MLRGILLLVPPLLLSAGRSAMPPPRDDVGTLTVPSHCRCRKVLLDVTLPSDPNDVMGPTATNCHCISCRKYHTAAYASYLRVPRGRVSIRRGADVIGTYRSTCQALGQADDGNDVERWHCKECASKLLSVPANSSDDDYGEWWVNLGPLDDDAIPSSHARRWKKQLNQKENNLHIDDACAWKDALPAYHPPPPSSTIPAWTGDCACGACRYRIAVTRPYQFQHCYCHLCREMHGGPFATWIPVYTRDFAWTHQSALSLVRTTPFGSRHVCIHCRGVLTIVYDSQPGLVWPCAGGIDDESLPSSAEGVGKYLKRVCHICCRHLPPWLDLPGDGMERIADAC